MLEIEGMTCKLCPLAIKKSLSSVEGVKDIEVSYEEGKAWLTVKDSVTDKSLSSAVKKAGFRDLMVRLLREILRSSPIIFFYRIGIKWVIL